MEQVWFFLGLGDCIIHGIWDSSVAVDPVGASGVIAPAPVSSRVMVAPVGNSGVVVAAVKDSGVDVTMVETSVLLWLHTKKQYQLVTPT